MQVPLLKNIYWKELSLLVYIWVGFLLVQIAKVIKPLCSVWFFDSLITHMQLVGFDLWILNIKQEKGAAVISVSLEPFIQEVTYFWGVHFFMNL